MYRFKNSRALLTGSPYVSCIVVLHQTETTCVVINLPVRLWISRSYCWEAIPVNDKPLLLLISLAYYWWVCPVIDKPVLLLICLQYMDQWPVLRLVQQYCCLALYLSGAAIWSIMTPSQSRTPTPEPTQSGFRHELYSLISGYDVIQRHQITWYLTSVEANYFRSDVRNVKTLISGVEKVIIDGGFLSGDVDGDDDKLDRQLSRRHADTHTQARIQKSSFAVYLHDPLPFLPKLWSVAG